MFCPLLCFIFFFFNDPATTEIYTLSLHDALPIAELLLAQKRQHSPLQAHHGADEGIEDDEQRELREILPQSEPHLAHSPVRLRRRFTAKASGCGGRSFSTKSTNSALEAARSAGLKRRSKPIVEPGLPLRPFPHAAPPKCAGKISR